MKVLVLVYDHDDQLMWCETTHTVKADMARIIDEALAEDFLRIEIKRYTEV